MLDQNLKVRESVASLYDTGKLNSAPVLSFIWGKTCRAWGKTERVHCQGCILGLKWEGGHSEAKNDKVWDGIARLDGQSASMAP